MAAPRIACVRIGRFATGVMARQRAVPLAAAGAVEGPPPEPVGPSVGLSAGAQPLALVTEIRGKPRIVAVCGEGARRGVTIGMTLAEARALAGDMVAEPYQPESIARAALEVTTALLAASPRVAWERGLGVWWVDAAGLGDERRLAARAQRIASALGFGVARCGVADAAIAAFAATIGGARAAGEPTGRRHGTPGTRRRAAGAHIVPGGGDAAYLAPFPIGLLDPDEDLADAFRALGLTRVGELAALAADEVEARFGAAGLAVHRLARGHDTRGPTTPRDDALPTISCDLGGAVATSEPLLFVLKGALGPLGDALRSRGLAARELTLTLLLDDGQHTARAIRPARPTTHPGALFDHLRSALEAWAVPAPVAGVTLQASVTVPASGEQGDLLVPRWADPAALAGAFDRIRAREGQEAVLVPERRDGHLPADAGGWAPADAYATAPAVRARRVSEPRRGPVAAPTDATPAALRLLAEPQPVRVRLGRAGLQAFRYQDAWRDVDAWAGPERLATRWWLGDGTRDYYTTRARDGTLWLLFRAVRERSWFLEGWWD